METVRKYFCESCGVELNAINMSDDDNYCQKCFAEIVYGMDIDESIETKDLSDKTMNLIINGRWSKVKRVKNT